MRIPGGPVAPYLSPRPTPSRARRTEIIPRTGLERRVEKTPTCFRRAGCKEPRCFSCSCSGSGSSLPLHHHPVVERRYSVMSSGTSAQNSATLLRLLHKRTPPLFRANRRTGDGRREERTGEAGWESRGIRNEYVSCLFSVIKCRQGGAARLKLIKSVRCAVSGVGGCQPEVQGCRGGP